MTEQDQTQALIHSRLRQASRTLEEGSLLLQKGFYTGAINRFYYSMFYGVTALLVSRQLGSSKHKGAISLFDREFVKPGDFPKEMSVWLHKAFQYRLEAEYADIPIATQEKAIEIGAQSDNFIQSIKQYLGD